MTLNDYSISGEVIRLTDGNKIAKPSTSRDRWGRFHRDDAGEMDWYYALSDTERAYVTKNYFSDAGTPVDVLASFANLDLETWADQFINAVRAARAKTIREADIFSEEYEEASAVNDDSSCYDDSMPFEDQFVGPVEAAELLQVKLNTIAVWRQRFDDFPEPVAVLSSTRIWHRDDILNWAAKHSRNVTSE